MAEYLTIGGPRMQELAERFADSFEAAERAKMMAIADAGDISPVEMQGLVLRNALSQLVGAVQAASLHFNIPIEDVTGFMVAALHAQIAKTPATLAAAGIGGNA